MAIKYADFGGHDERILGARNHGSQDGDGMRNIWVDPAIAAQNIAREQEQKGYDSRNHRGSKTYERQNLKGMKA